MSTHRTYLVIETGSQPADQVCPPGSTRVFEGAGLRELVERVESAAEHDRANGQHPAGLILVAGPDTSVSSIELRARLMGAVAESMLPFGGDLRVSASYGRPRLAALALLEWVREGLIGTGVTVALADEPELPARAA